MKPFDLIKQSRAYADISEFYGERRAERSRVPLMDHIRDGLVVLDQINASFHAMQAWCLHPMFQADKDLAQTVRCFGPFWEHEPHVLLLVMEYRYRANAWLSEKVQRPPMAVGTPAAGDLEEVWHMLIADKVQNRKDFLTHHKGTHPRSAELELYFGHWLLALDVDEAEFNKLCAAIDAAKS